MAKGFEVMEMLIPTGGWIITGNEYEGIQFLECEPITKDEFDAAFNKYDAWKAQKDLSKQEQKQALLSKLGITADEAKLLLS